MIVMEKAERCMEMYSIHLSAFSIGNFIKEETPELELEKAISIGLNNNEDDGDDRTNTF